MSTQVIGELDYRILKHVLDYIKDNNDYEVKVSKLARALGVDAKAVRGSLDRLARYGIFSKVDRNTYDVDPWAAKVFADWYEYAVLGLRDSGVRDPVCILSLSKPECAVEFARLLHLDRALNIDYFVRYAAKMHSKTMDDIAKEIADRVGVSVQGIYLAAEILGLVILDSLTSEVPKDSILIYFLKGLDKIYADKLVEQIDSKYEEILRNVKGINIDIRFET